jgi:hypothetical protein
MSYLVRALLIVVPFVALAATGIILACRHRTVPSALAAVAFSAATFAQLLSIFVGFYTFTPRADLASAFHGISWMVSPIYWGSVGGLLVGSLSLLWHTLGQRAPASPNNRWRGP